MDALRRPGARLIVVTVADARGWDDMTAEIAVAALDPLLDLEERARASRFRRRVDRDAYVLAHAAVRVVAGAAVGRSPSTLRLDRRCRRCGHASHGKPRLVDGGSFEFSASHSEGVAVVAHGDGVPLGVDIEVLGPRVADAAHQAGVLAPSEQRAIASVPPDRRQWAFLRTWTRKEALAKASGVGLALPLDEYEVTGPDDPPAVQRAPADLGQWRLVDVDAVDGAVVALAHAGCQVPIVTESWSPLLGC